MSNPVLRWRGLVTISVLFVALPAFAQIEQARLNGTVTDAQGGVLPGVTVTVRSSALIGAQSTVTEGDGRYRFPALPGGAYDITFELTGFQTVKREGVVLRLGQTLTVDSQLPVATLQETVTVTSESPVVDVTTTAVGTTFDAEKLTSIPTATDMWAVLSQAPGVRMQGYDVGGSHKSQALGYEGFGIRGQSQFTIDGIQSEGNYPNALSMEEIAVSAAGGDVEINSPGAAIALTIKSGGNTFHSLNNLAIQRESFVSDNLDDETAVRGFTGNPNIFYLETHHDIGGPIKRDRMWFFLSYNYFKIDKIVSGIPQAIATDLGIFHEAPAKLTYKLSQADTLPRTISGATSTNRSADCRRRPRASRCSSRTAPIGPARFSGSGSGRIGCLPMSATGSMGSIGRWCPTSTRSSSPPRIDVATNQTAARAGMRSTTSRSGRSCC